MNVLMLAIDTLRADHLSCYGYRRPTSPVIDRLAGQGTLLEQFIAPAIPTHPSFTTLFSGQHPIRHGVVAQSGKAHLNRSTPTIAQLFLEKEYLTASFDTLPSHLPHFGRGYEMIVDSSRRRGCGLMVMCEEINHRVIQFLKQRAGEEEPFFAFVHYWDPHTPYWAPPRYRSMFYDGDPCDKKKDTLQPLYDHPLGNRWKDTWLKTVLRDMGCPEDAEITDADFVEALYDQEIRHIDDGIGDVLETLEKSGLAEDTLVIVMADHGECMTEHGINFDHHGLYNENVHVPFVARMPGTIPAGKRIPQTVQHFDILPTLAEAAGLRVPEHLDGKSAWGLLTGARPDETLAERVIHEECSWQMKWSLRDANYNFILARQEDWYGNPLRELYDLRTDPRETTNIAAAQPDIVKELESDLEGWIASRVKNLGLEQDPLLTHGISMVDPASRKKASKN